MTKSLLAATRSASIRHGGFLIGVLLQVATSTGHAQERPDTGASAGASGGSRRVRRIPLTAELERSAFGDERARTLLHRARAARSIQDSALQSYDAKSYLRMSLGLGIRRLGPERLLFRTEHAARVRWTRESGVWIETTGRRHLVPMGGADLDLSEMTPVPYFPGREALWLPSSELRTVRDEVNENDLLHPLATGAEAYYRYETGDSIQIQLSDRAIQLRELRITARRPEWRAFVGSFWFDTERGSLVRAAYRMAAEIDIWREVSEEQRRQIRELEERVRTDTGTLVRGARDRLDSIRGEGRGTAFAGMLLSPMRAKVSGITVEYGLYEGRFWLPKQNVFEGEMLATFIRLPVKYEESYRYDRVNGGETIPRVPVIGEAGMTADDTLYVSRGFVNIGSGPPRTRADTSVAAHLAREDSVMRYRHRRGDSLTALADSLRRTDGDTVRINNLRLRAARNRSIIRTMVRRREECARDSTYFAGTSTMYDGALRIGIRFPCDTAKLATSPDLPASILTDDDQLFSAADRDQLLAGLDFALQPGWGPQPPRFHTGLDLLRYNRIEGLSLGASVTSVLGMGYTAQGLGRFGVADRVFNGELSLARSNGRADVALRLFHRLGVANDDWGGGSPLSFGASVANLLYARDEGFYYRTWGVEVGGNRAAPGPMTGARLRWRLFAERQYSAGAVPNTQASLGRWLGNARFADNIAAQQLVAVGAGAELARSFGIDPKGTRFDARIGAEGAATNRSDSVGATGYGRLVLDGTVSRPFGRFALAVTGAGGSSVGDLPVQRAFYIGGLHTVRGQFARPAGEGRVGDTFWLGRAELGTSFRVLRPTVFYDVGWAGSRDAVRSLGRPLSGAGAGLSLLDGLFRVDVSRGIHPDQRWRTDLYIGARF